MITALIILPVWISILVRAYAWIVVLGRRGLANSMLQFLHLTDAPVQLLYNRFAIDIALSDFDGEVEPVSDAIEIDPTQLMQALLGGLSGAGGTGGGGFDCDQLIGAPKQVIDLYKEECPELAQ